MVLEIVRIIIFWYSDHDEPQKWRNLEVFVFLEGKGVTSYAGGIVPNDPPENSIIGKPSRE